MVDACYYSRRPVRLRDLVDCSHTASRKLAKATRCRSSSSNSPSARGGVRSFRIENCRRHACRYTWSRRGDPPHTRRFGPMKDLTQGPVNRDLLHMSPFLAVGMVVEAAYFVGDLYWVGPLGK